MSTINGNYREFRLDNGLFVALQETPTQTVSGRLRVSHGALNESKGEEGLAHFLEHVIFSGGSKNYRPEKSDTVKGMFGSFNACTALERTFFPVDMLAEDTELFLKYISDIAFNPLFDESRVWEEKQRVLREIADEKSSPIFNDSRAYYDAFYGKGSPHAYFILGEEEVIRHASIDKLKDFHRQGYNPNNMDLILVGALPKNIERLIEENFSSFPVGQGKKVEFPRNPQLKGPIVIHTVGHELLNQENPSESSAQVNIGLVAPPATEEDSFATGVLTYILGGNANSRLFTNVSQRRGLAYHVGAGFNGTNNKGIISISGSVHALKSNEAIDAIFEEMKRLQDDLVPQEDLERVRRAYQYNSAKTIETNEGHVHAIELKQDYGVTPDYHLRKLGEVTPEKIREAARKYFPEDRKNGKYLLLLRDPLKRD